MSQIIFHREGTKLNIRSRRNALGWGSSNKLSPKNNSVSIHLNNVGTNYSLIITPIEFEVDIIRSTENRLRRMRRPDEFKLGNIHRRVTSNLESLFVLSAKSIANKLNELNKTGDVDVKNLNLPKAIEPIVKKII